MSGHEQLPAEEPDAKAPITDLALAVPLGLIPVLALGLAGLMVAAYGGDRVLVSLVPFAALLAAVAVVDLRELRIPNRLLGPAAILAVPLLAIAATSDWPELSLPRALLGAVVYGGIYFVLWFVYPAGMGMGDVKLAVLLGAQLGLFGWIPLVRGIIISHFVAGIVAVIVLVVRAASRRHKPGRTAFPFGPFMVVGAVTALALHAWY